MCKACRNYVKFVLVCYLVPGIGLKRRENGRDVLFMRQIGLVDQEKEVHVYLENVDQEGGPVSEIGPVIEVHAMPINCSAKNVVEAVAEECTQNGIEDIDVDGAKGGSDDENEVVRTGVQDAETEVVETGVETKPEVIGVETEVNNDADDDEVKEHDGDVEFSDHSESDPDYVYVSPEDDGQSSDTLTDSYQSEEFQSFPNSDDEGDSNSKIMYPHYNPTSSFGQVHLEVGMEFDTIKMFIEVVRDFTIFHGRDLKWVKVDTIRAKARCKQVGCSWEIYCSWSEVTKAFKSRLFWRSTYVEGSSKINRLQ